MAFAPAALLKIFRRGKAKDPFGGDEPFAGESRFAGKGPKIALAASAVLFLLLVGGIGAIIATGDPTLVSQPVTGSLADIEVVEDSIDPTVVAAATPAPGAPAPIIDPTAATDRSAERRPWLAVNNTPQVANPPRPGVVESKPPAPVAPPLGATPSGALPPAPPPESKVAEVKKAAEAKGPEVKAPETKTSLTKAPESKTTPAKPGDAKVAAVMAPPAATAPVLAAPAQPPVSAASATQAVPAEEDNDPNRDIGGIPALNAAGQVPGAPRRFDGPIPGADTGPAIAGGRPRLVDPPFPPTDKIAVSAPPPRYASLTDVKGDTGQVAPAASASKIAFIVSGLGLNQGATLAAIHKLPAGVTLAFSPYARGLKKWTDLAKEKGHEVLIELPMESKQFPAEDPGPLGLLTSVEAKENNERLDAVLKEGANAIGVLDTMRSKFRESREHINPVFAKLKQANLFYVQGMPGVRVGEAAIPTAIADLVIDERPFRAAIDARLDYAERLAKYQGSAVVGMGAKPVNFERLVLWIEQAQKKGVTLAPISQVLIK